MQYRFYGLITFKFNKLIRDGGIGKAGK